jgi:hypothetical protein
MTNQLVSKGLSYREEPVFVSTPEEYLLLKRRQQFRYVCKNCGLECSAQRRTEKSRTEKQLLFLCQGCLTKHVCNLKYGTDYACQSKQVKETIKETNLKKYGCENVFQCNDIKEKSKKTCLKKYGTEYANQSEPVKQKIKDTNLKRYGVENVFQADFAKEKSRKTCNERYGTDWYASTDACKERIKNTNLEKYKTEYTLQSSIIREKGIITNRRLYGTDYYTQTEEYKERARKTCLEKYGVYPYTRTIEYQKLARRKYCFNGEMFDSSWEVYFYYYCIKTNKGIIRNVQKFEYSFNGKEYYCFPDFNVEGKLYEIKGDQFFKSNGTMQNPFNHDDDERMEAKHQCLLNNGVIILRRSDIKAYKNLFEQDFGKHYLSSLRVNI